MQSNGLGRHSSALSFYSEPANGGLTTEFPGIASRIREHVGLIRLHLVARFVGAGS